MFVQYEIRCLTALDREEILPVVSGYESRQKFAVRKVETTDEITIRVHVISLDAPHSSGFADDFNDSDMERYRAFIDQGCSLAAYSGGQMIALALCQSLQWNRSLQVWEFHVKKEFQHQGVGRALMDRVFAKAREQGARVVFLETQNTNVPAIRFYQAMGFSLDALDLSFYTNHDAEDGEVAFFMKKKLE
jgi:streptothricin acetyltransferase